jgi:predicted permease
MPIFQRFVGGLKGLIRSRRVEQELDEELRAYLESSVEARVRAGMTPEGARRAARVAFGSIEAVKDRVRDVGWESMFENLLQDVRYALRVLRRSPAFTAVAVLSLALGIGANTSVFTLICGELFPVLTYPHATRLVKLVAVTTGGSTPTRLSDAEMLSAAANLNAVEEVAAVSGRAFHLTGGGSEPERLLGAGVSTNFFQFLGVSPLIGRRFLPDDGPPGAERVAIITDGLWRSRFGGSPGAVGQRITLNDEPHTIIGVVHSDSWLLPEVSKIYVPAMFDASQSTRARNNFDWEGYARLRPGAAPEAIDVEAASASWAIRPTGNGWRTLHGVPLAHTVFVDREENRQELLLLQTTVGFVLFIACMNVGSLLLARATARQHEFTLRTALGAGRGRLFRQLLAESLLLASVAGIGGLLLSIGGTRVVANIWGWHQTASFDPRVLVFTSAVGLGTAILASLAPARHLLRHSDQKALREHGRTAGVNQKSRRMLQALLVCEISLALGLLLGAGALIKSLSVRLQRTPGFATANLLLARTHFLGARYAATTTKAEFIRRAVDEIESLPGVRAAAVVDPYPPAGDAVFPIRAAGPHVFGDDPPLVRHRSVTVGYVRTLGISMIRGRDFDRRDVGSVPDKVIINEAMARRFWPGENPVGGSITTTRAGATAVLDVIGVVATADNNIEYRNEPRPEIIELTAVPSQAPWFMVRTDRDAMQVLPSIRQAVAAVDPNQPLAAIRTVEGWIAQESAGHRSLTQFLASFAVLALALVAIGIYGIVSYTASLRRREVGVRIALGASRVSIVGMFVGDTVRLLVVSIPLGLASSWALTRWMAALLFGVGPAEPSVLVTACGCVVAAISLAAIRPVWDCSRIDPASVLRAE